MQIDETDAELMRLLAGNARLPVATLARRLGLARTTVQARIERLERDGAIAGYTLRRGAAARAAIRATVLVSIEPRAAAGVLTRLRALRGVEACHTTSGRFDMILEVAADSTAELDRTLDEIGDAQGVRGSESLIHLTTKIDRR
ncbi:Lrp/AsnC family transcriptional regulator [Roseivivax isoporae]|uniref:AsnC family transcriptional regulator n=1 Tax=Roseivivax isoporae LMG 25204 TaxID=1449351 RepID=X7F5N5_9RHOB|nr:Lrp/AsnC family transcriptional regulator [Roseivivax isoporae]ETX27411.1 AsnC family transcriptional regulator [Roseivivax isoporae LMG 25204]